jgi:type IV fimbrial biogenesis protein FimT
MSLMTAHGQAGLTLFEMLITVSILAIMVTVVGPNVSNILTKNRITADINSLSAIAQQARFTAVNEQVTVTLCPSIDYINCVQDWQRAKMVFIDSNGNSKIDNNETLIATSDPINQRNLILGASGSFLFFEDGSIDTRASIILCPDTKEAGYASALLLTLNGRITVAIDSDNDGLKEDLSGSALACSTS